MIKMLRSTSSRK